MQTSPCNDDLPLPHFHIVKLGFTGVCIIFLFFLYNKDCGYSLDPLSEAVLLCTHDLYFEKNMKIVTFFI